MQSPRIRTVAEEAQVALRSGAGTDSRTLIMGPSQSCSTSSWSPGISYQEMEKKMLKKCLIQREVHTNSDHPSSLRSLFLFPGAPLLPCECFASASLEEGFRSCFAQASRTGVPESVCLSGATLANDCRRDKAQPSGPELDQPLSCDLHSRVPLKPEAETLPQILCWLGLLPFPALPPQSLTASCQEHFLYHLLAHKSCLRVCFWEPKSRI